MYETKNKENMLNTDFFICLGVQKKKTVVLIAKGYCQDSLNE